MAKRRMGRYPKAFNQMAVERMNQCENIVALSQELGVSRRLLYTWSEKLEPVESGDGPPATSRESTLRHEVSRLKRVLAEKVLEVDFQRGLATPSRRDASGAEKLARRHLRPHPGRDVEARPIEYRTDVSSGAGEAVFQASSAQSETLGSRIGEPINYSILDEPVDHSIHALPEH